MNAILDIIKHSDFLMKNMNNDIENIKKVFKEILSIECSEDALSFDVDNITVEDIMEEKTYILTPPCRVERYKIPQFGIIKIVSLR